MTGFGSASHSRAGLTVTAEARSLNNRFLKVAVRCPPLLSSREHELEALVRARAARGTVSLTVRVDLPARPVRIGLNVEAVREYMRLFDRLRRDTGVEGSPDLGILAGLQGVFDVEEVNASLSDEDYELVQRTVAAALDRMVRMRTREGSNLKRDFRKRRTRIAALVREIDRRAPRVKDEYLARIEDRVGRLLEARGVEISEADLVRELAVFAERSDVAEELTRLRSHLDQYGEALGEGEEVGRRLEFLVQEMLREANTIGAKSGDVEVSRLCVELKVELDRLKEQVQNVE